MEPMRAHGIDEWSQICSASFVPLRAAGDDGFRGVVGHLPLGDVGVSYVESTASRVFRPRALIAAEPRDDVLLSIHLSGCGWVHQSERVARLTSDTAAIYEADRAYELRFGGPMRELVLQVPRARLRIRDSVLRDATARLVPSGAGMTILRHLLTGMIVAGSTPEGAQEELAETAVDLLSFALRPFATGRGPQPALSGESLRYAVRVFLQRNHADPGLSIESVARHHGVSRRYLELLFARHGESPAAYLRGLRLQHARELLAGSAATVTAIANEVGFADVNTFIRAFRRQSEQTPEKWRLAVRHAGSKPIFAE
jgi:AraC-like DNA-binding protein